MKFTAIFALFFATASMVFATPTGHAFMRAECDIAGCVAALAGGVVACAAAASQAGANLFADAGCLAAAANTVANFPADCNNCVEEFGIDKKVQAAGGAIKNTASGAVEDVQGAAGKVGDGIGGIGAKIKGFFGSLF